MATVYNIKLTSHWISFTENQIKEKIEKALKEVGNEITVEISK